MTGVPGAGNQQAPHVPGLPVIGELAHHRADGFGAISEIRDAWVLWLETVAWEWFATMTGLDFLSLDHAQARFRNWRNSVNRKAWGRRYFTREAEGLWGIACWERQNRGDWHAHVLVSGTNGLDPSTGKREWDRVRWSDSGDGGRHPVMKRLAKIERFHRDGAAIAYCTKRLGNEVRGDAYADPFGPWPRR